MVNGWNPDATSALAPSNPQLSPGDDEVIISIDVEMTYLEGDRSSETPFYGVDLAVVGQDGRVITPADTPCVGEDPVFDMDAALGLGSTARGNICFLVQADQAESVQLVAAPSMSPGAEPSRLALG